MKRPSGDSRWQVIFLLAFLIGIPVGCAIGTALELTGVAMEMVLVLSILAALILVSLIESWLKNR
jgi:hypothetical protein